MSVQLLDGMQAAFRNTTVLSSVHMNICRDADINANLKCMLADTLDANPKMRAMMRHTAAMQSLYGFL